MPALIIGTQALGEPRYPSLKGIMAARSQGDRDASLADLGLDAGDASAARSPRRRSSASRRPPARAATRVVRGTPDEAAREIVDFLAERRLI